MPDIYQFLDSRGIAYERHDHPAVYTVEEANRLVPPLPAAKTKNLFLRDKKGRIHFLVSVPSEKAVDLKALADLLEVNNLSLGSPDRLMKYLGIEPGSVSMLAVLNDSALDVQVVIDEDLWQADAFQCHPLVNTSTLVISKAGLQKFFEATNHSVRTVKVPERE